MKSISLRRAAVASPVVAVLGAVALSAALAAREPARRPLVTEVVPDHAAGTFRQSPGLLPLAGTGP